MIEDIRKKEKFIERSHFLSDIFLTCLSFVASYYSRNVVLPFMNMSDLAVGPNYYVVLLMIVLIWSLVFHINNVYTGFAEKSFPVVIRDVIKSVSFSMMILIAALFVFKIHEVSRLLLGIFYTINIIALTAVKRIFLELLKNYKQNQQNFHNILIVGSRRRAEGVIGLIKSSGTGYTVIGCLDTRADSVGKEVLEGVKVIGTMDDLKNIMQMYVIDEIIFAMPLKEIESVQVYMVLIELTGVTVRIFPDWHIYSVLYQPGIARMYFDDFNGVPTMLITATTSKYRDLLIKNILDMVLSFIGIIVLMPLLIVISLLIKLISPRGPVLFKQKRMGLYGREFYLYKFRTMIPDAEAMLEKLRGSNEADGPAFKIKNDPRIIPFIGRLLRKTGLDELPQLFNIIKGEMSLVGPRPPLGDEVRQYNVWQRRRLSMKPGLTCIWQIAPGRNDISFNKWMEMDLEYIDNWSLLLDFQLIWRTLRVVIKGHGR